MSPHDPKADFSHDSKADFSHNEDLKKELSHVENQEDFKDIDYGFEAAEVKRITKKVDRRLIPVLSMMYGISLIDRTNLAIARAANDGYMNTELGLKDNDRYSIITLIFFVPYIILEIPVS